MHPLRVVLCASDLGEASGEAIDQAAQLARADGASLVVVHVVPALVLTPEPVGEAAVYPMDAEVIYRQGEEALERQLRGRAGASAATRRVLRASGSVVDELLGCAGSLRAGLVVVASHRRSLVERALLGSTALALVRRAPCPVLVARRSAQRGVVVAATDLSVASIPALRAAAEEARRRGARLIAVHALDLPPAELTLGNAVVPAPPDDPRSRPVERRTVEQRLAAFLREAEVDAQPLVAEGAAASSIVALAEQASVELIALGTTGGGRLERALLGSVAEAVVRRAPCSVLTVPARRGPRALDLLDE